MPARRTRFVIAFPEGQAAFAIRASHRMDLPEVMAALGFREPRPTIYMTGGAGGMSPEDIKATRHIVEHGLARFAQDEGAIVIDGGTTGGINSLIGESRRKHRYSFPLIGIAPLERVTFPGYQPNDGRERYPLQPGHSHFILTPGADFGAESETITRMTYTLAGEGRRPALGVLINGGQITRKEVLARTTWPTHPFPLIVIQGTGRFADLLAQAMAAGSSDEQDIRRIIDNGRLLLASVQNGPDELYLRLRTLFREHHQAAATGGRRS